MSSVTEPFVSRTFQSPDGLRLHYRDYAGPADAPFTVICLPGLTRNARDFEQLAPHLATRYRVWCLEFRGRGESEYASDPMTYVPPTYVRDLAALFKATGLGQAALIGTSLGGLVSTIFAALMPAKVLGVVLNDIGPELDPTGLARIASYVGKTRPVASWEDAADVVEMLDRVVYPEYTRADWLRMGRRRFVKNPDGTFRPNYDLDISKPFTAKTPDLWPFFRRLRVMPSLVIRGAHSDLLALATVVRMKAEIPSLRTVEVPNRGHAPNLDEPEALAAIDRLLADLPSRIGRAAKVGRTLGALKFLAKMKWDRVI